MTAPSAPFRVRAYGRTELAQLYLPHITPGRAWRKLRSWIGAYPGLSAQLRRLGYRPEQRMFTPLQVKTIADCLGDP